MKRKITQQTTSAGTKFSKKHKNLRSKLPRRRRALISPIIFNFAKSNPAFSFNSNCDEVSCNTTLASVVLPPNARYCAKNEVALKLPKKGAVEVSVSENSCVESCSVVAAEGQLELHKLKQSQNGAVPSEFSAVLNSPSTITTAATVEQRPAKSSCDLIGILGSELVCTEDFSYGDYEVSFSAEFRSEVFSGEFCSEFGDYTDDYTPSIWLNSGSQFSEKSSDDSTPSPCFSLFKELCRQFVKLRSDHYDSEVSSLLNDEYSDELAYWRFEEEEDEESYRRLRSRERSEAAKVKDYFQEYDFATEYGGLIVEQRLLMVNWIIEISRKKDLQNETMFLGVRLLDRFLSHGFFTSRRNLQLLGIACLTLAIRIEENQPYNRFYLKAATANVEMQQKAKYLAGLALLDHKQLQFWPSTVAAGLVILVSLSTGQDESCQRVVQAHVRTKIDDLLECIKNLEWLVKYAL